MIRPLFAALLLVAAATATGATAETPTRAVLFTVTDPVSGKLRAGFTVTEHVRGTCWTGSLAAQRSDAWRCMADNAIHDPCYAATTVATVVYCPTLANAHRLLALTLTKRLPLEQANGDRPALRRPTTITLAGGVTCGFLTGATAAFAGMRMNYGCSDGRTLLGDVDRSTPRWHIFALAKGGASAPVLTAIDSATF